MEEKWAVKVAASAKNDVRKALQSSYRESYLAIVAVLKEDPFKPNQFFERLNPPGDGKYSRRINVQHRVIYTVDKVNRKVRILAAWSHYG
ncbi:Txe/YoeB family addiction module toxin [Lapidilactobacillus bayanensis]|uniref:Txe/YoeB family addiction module toxin n=1 Tax=Lapidilactobacillus bayanensis TaxID=2485998 RepID=UPI000F7783E1|nr:Txe/YoeB family addiction module toxin [Lapidilactobacillus bayanensis]